jgi:transcriptional regulator with XRE-family HTH domain
MATATRDPVAAKIREIWAAKRAEGWTFLRLGLAMGYPPAQARQAAQQFLRGGDPRISSLRRFAGAVGVSVATLVRG